MVDRISRRIVRYTAAALLVSLLAGCMTMSRQAERPPVNLPAAAVEEEETAPAAYRAGANPPDQAREPEAAASVPADYAQPPASGSGLSSDYTSSRPQTERPATLELTDLPPSHAGGTVVSSGQTDSSRLHSASWEADKPKLGYISLGDTVAAVKSIYDTPSETYPLEDRDETLTVHAHKGLLVGYSRAGTVRFVEIYSSEVPTGLNGLRVDQPEDAVIQALGQPTAHSSYAMTYEASGALLKLDLDPSTYKVLSIKLFRA